MNFAVGSPRPRDNGLLHSLLGAPMHDSTWFFGHHQVIIIYEYLTIAEIGNYICNDPLMLLASHLFDFWKMFNK